MVKSEADDIVNLAEELAEIASLTTDPEAARRLMQVVKRLLAAAGLPRDDDCGGGGSVPRDWLMEPECAPA